MTKMQIWEQVHNCPQEALSPILGGKLKGKSDISPIWRYKRLTELFGPVGICWATQNVRFQTYDTANGEIAVICLLELIYRGDEDAEWSDPVMGQGGSMFVATEKGQLVTNDEAFKMAYTDAISVACKQLGFAADVYWSKGSDSKYQRFSDDDPLGTGNTEKRLPPRGDACEVCGAKMTAAQKALSQQKYGRLLCPACQNKEVNNAE